MDASFTTNHKVSLSKKKKERKEELRYACLLSQYLFLRRDPTRRRGRLESHTPYFRGFCGDYSTSLCHSGNLLPPGRSACPPTGPLSPYAVSCLVRVESVPRPDKRRQCTSLTADPQSSSDWCSQRRESHRSTQSTMSPVQLLVAVC